MVSEIMPNTSDAVPLIGKFGLAAKVGGAALPAHVCACRARPTYNNVIVVVLLSFMNADRDTVHHD